MDGGAGENDAPPESKPELFGGDNPNKNNSPNNSETIRIEPSEPPSQASSDKIKKIGKVGRKRKYEGPGIDDIPPVKEVVLFRYKMGRHWPGMSDDMREWYEFYYFTKPNRGDRAKDARDYERHVKSYERGRKWIAEECGIEALGDSRKIVAIRKRSSS